MSPKLRQQINISLLVTVVIAILSLGSLWGLNIGRITALEATAATVVPRHEHEQVWAAQRHSLNEIQGSLKRIEDILMKGHE